MFKPKYKKIIDNIILQIDTGELEPGMQLASQRDMARKYQVNRSTVIQAIDILKSQGIIKGREKQRLYVSGNTWHTYIRNNINWQNYISNSTTKNNQYFVQQINKLEFHSNMMRLSTGERPKPLKSFDANDNILYLNSLSKTVSPGLRVGWIVAKPSVVAHLADLKMQNDYGASSISQYIATEWLTQTHYHDQHLKGLKDKLLIKRNLFLESLNKYFSNLGSWSTPEGSFYIWFQFKYSIDMKKLFDAAIAENILINPGEVYDKHAHHCIRFSYAYIDADDIDVALKRLSEIIQTRFTTSS
ncbi:aminotransferase class I/II-fold pyridoxal phosphate-dependent enzyme [Staphylococcus sp. KG4-3]|uniref:Aminotransferase class I/II-fold pyridoxal phosphate-dependent enzyme n=1 Tax=Staphylococcus xylosus TaxID=1288 RepID=A0A418IMD1_STAXY|nr:MULTISPECIES: aminotransferase class I/II-fold pyridoxal phosphate-dependent enzyme [Staphylococcus]MDW8544007.1 aminotransferase class I/II-fold pyridoxal phosphate-dependent enzyme [Staphylococcus sp. KG4-1]MDW8561246.1 aminotransferase class I/II-fold pyridoxal phosphate-dependent enzyme [Staphylococcus sp. KG4-3]RIN10005.1 aminotransferase class I/II-fold pyridoxal phosphate-dependent enzyme [Staphylococcus xylosus]